MASVTIKQVKRADVAFRNSSQATGRASLPEWGEWESASGLWLYMHSGLSDTDTVYYSILKLGVDVTNQRGLVNLSLTLPFVGWGTAKLRAYLYLTEPTPVTSGVNAFFAPSGYQQYVTLDKPVGSNTDSTNCTFNFTNIGVMDNRDIYIWFEIAHTCTAGSGYYNYSIQFSGTAGSTLRSILSHASMVARWYGIPTGITISPGNVTTGDSISVNIGNAYVTETVKFYYGSTLLGSASITNGIGSVTVPASWFDTAGITTSKTMSVLAIVDGTSVYTTITVTAGSDAAPVVGTPTSAIVQSPDASDFPNDYLANISSTKIAAEVTLRTNALLAAVTLSYPGGGSILMSYNSTTQKYEATTPPLQGNTTFTITALDVRGMTGTNTVTVSGVIPYVPPSITIDENYTWRCDSSGNEESGGLYVRVKAYATYYSALTGNALLQFKFYVQEDPSSGDNLTSGVQSGPVSFVNQDDYGTVVVVIQDKISGVITKSLRLAGLRRNIALRRSTAGTYMGVGMLSGRTSGKSCVELPDGGDFLIGGYPVTGMTHLYSSDDEGTTFSKNFRNVDTNTMYAGANTEAFFDKPASDSSWSNIPSARSGVAWKGLRRVVWISGTCMMIQIFEMEPEAGRIWVNYYDGSNWTGWRYTASAL